MNDLSYCPECGSSWDNGPIPESMREFYSPPYRWSRLIGVEIQGQFDGVSLWQCPDCKTQWDRFTGKRVKNAQAS